MADVTINGTEYEGVDKVNLLLADGSGVAVYSESGASGLSDAEKEAMITLFKNATYTKNVSATITLLETLWNVSGDDTGGGDNSGSGDVPVTLTSISAVYSGGDVAVGTALTDLTGIVVTATYSDGSTAPVTGYTLSGTIAEGSNTITVTYEGKTATFTVTGVAAAANWETLPMTYQATTTNMSQGKIYSDNGTTEVGIPGRGFYHSEAFTADTDVSVTVTNTGVTCYACYGVYETGTNVALNLYNATTIEKGDPVTVEMTIPSGNRLIVCNNYQQHFTVEAKKKVVS